MTTTTITRRSATPARVWVPAVAIPGVATATLLWLSRATSGAFEGMFFALAMTLLVVTCVIGPLVCLAHRLRTHEYLYEDDSSDTGYRVRRLEVDNAALSLALDRLTRPEDQVVGWVPLGVATPKPPLRLVRDDGSPRWN